MRRNQRFDMSEITDFVESVVSWVVNVAIVILVGFIALMSFATILDAVR